MEKALTPPIGLIEPGEHPDGSSTALLTLYACTDRQGQVWSAHDFRSPEDARVASKWAGGGVRHIAHALLMEAVRREAFVCALIEITQKSDFLNSFENADAQGKQEVLTALASQVERNLNAVIPKLSVGSAQEVLEMLKKQLMVDRVETHHG